MNLVMRAISRACVYSGFANMCDRKRRSSRKPTVTILAYHRIGCPESEGRGLDSKLLSASPAGFNWQMEYLRSHFEVLSFEDMVDRFRMGQPLAPNTALVTFDDGYRDNYDLAYPILHRHDLPATIFLTTGLIGSKQRMWWDELAAIIGTTEAKRVCVPGLGEIRLETSRDRVRTKERLRHHFKAISEDERRDGLNALMSELGSRMQPEFEERVHLSWDEVRVMNRNRITFGAHTHSHTILTRVSMERAEQEIADSKRIVERELGQPVRFFAYPNGQPGDFNAHTRMMLIEHGFEAAVTLVHGSNSLGNDCADLFALRRIYVGSDDQAVFIAKVSGALETLAARFPF
ncbi:MAG: polysaccharide deacetylase family protein [Anaerolineae bacterium]